MITPNQIQTIVDGECSHECRALLLHEIESQPAAWRALALALLEEQQWSKQIAELAKRKTPVSIAQHASSSRFVSENALFSSAPVQSLVQLSGVGLHGTSNEVIGSKGFPWLTILAASLLLGLGFYGGSFLPKFDKKIRIPFRLFSLDLKVWTNFLVDIIPI